MNAARSGLLEAGSRLAQTMPLREFDPARLCAEAGLEADAFDAVFGDLQTYLVALQQRFIERARARIAVATAGIPGGQLRVQRALETYLDECLEQRALRRWLTEAGLRADTHGPLRRQNEAHRLMFSVELGALGWPQPSGGARLLLTMVAEAAVIEHRIGKPAADIRTALADFLARGGPQRD